MDQVDVIPGAVGSILPRVLDIRPDFDTPVPAEVVSGRKYAFIAGFP